MVSIIEHCLPRVLQMCYFYRIKYIMIYLYKIVGILRISCALYEHRTQWRKPTATHWKIAGFVKITYNHIQCTLVIHHCGLLIKYSAKILFQACTNTWNDTSGKLTALKQRRSVSISSMRKFLLETWLFQQSLLFLHVFNMFLGCFVNLLFGGSISYLD